MEKIKHAGRGLWAVVRERTHDDDGEGWCQVCGAKRGHRYVEGVIYPGDCWVVDIVVAAYELALASVDSVRCGANAQLVEEFLQSEAKRDA